MKFTGDATNNEDISVKKKKAMNWQRLPKKIKEQIIEKVDFKSRFSLRSTSRANRDLVDSKKWPIQHVNFTKMLSFDDRLFTIAVADHNIISVANPTNYAEFYKKLIPFAVYIFEFGLIESCIVEGVHENIANYLKGKFEQIHIDNIELKGVSAKTALFFLEKCQENLLAIQWEPTAGEIPWSRIFSLPAVVNVLISRIIYDGPVSAIDGLVQKWIDRNSRIGTCIIFVSSQNDIFEDFEKIFQNRVLSKYETSVRISTGDPETNIIKLHHSTDKHGLVITTTQIVVIPSYCSDELIYQHLCQSQK